MYQGDMIIGRLAMGADWLNPAAAMNFKLLDRRLSNGF